MNDIDLNRVKTKEGAKQLREELATEKMKLCERIRMIEEVLKVCNVMDPQPVYRDARD